MGHFIDLSGPAALAPHSSASATASRSSRLGVANRAALTRLFAPRLCSGPAEHAAGVRGVRAARPETERAASGHLSAGGLPDQPVPAAGAEPRSPGQRPAVRGHVPQLAAQRLRHVRVWWAADTHARRGPVYECCAFVCLSVYALGKSALCHSKPESSLSARLTWRINTDVSHRLVCV